MFNNHHTNIVGNTSGILPKNKFDNLKDNTESVKSIIKQYQNHPSILEIKRKFPNQQENLLLKDISIKSNRYRHNTP